LRFADIPLVVQVDRRFVVEVDTSFLMYLVAHKDGWISPAFFGFGHRLIPKEALTLFHAPT